MEYSTIVDIDTLWKRRITINRHFYGALVLVRPKLSIESGVSVHSFRVMPSGGCAPVSGVVHMLTSHLPESEMWVHICQHARYIRSMPQGTRSRAPPVAVERNSHVRRFAAPSCPGEM